MLGVLCVVILFCVIGSWKLLIGGIFALVIAKWLLGTITAEAKINVGKN